MNSSSLTSEQAAALIAVTRRYLDFVHRLNARMIESHFPLDDCLNEATRLLLPHVEAHAKLLAELKARIETVKEVEAAKGYQILPNTTRRERYRHVPPQKPGDVF